MKQLKDYEYYRTELGVLYCGDCLEILPLIEEKVDLVLTDPPYGQTSCSWDKIVDINIMYDKLYKISKKDNIFIFTSIQPFATKLINQNIDNFKYDIIWDKGNTTGFLDAKKKPLRQHEIILIFSSCSIGKFIYNPIMRKGIMRKKGGYQKESKTGDKVYGNKTKNNPTINDNYYPTSIINIGTVYRNNYIHPTQKPISLFEYLLKTYSNENQLILDPFFGSGTTGVACEKLNRRYIGIEISEKYCGIAKQRIDTETMQGKLEDKNGIRINM